VPWNLLRRPQTSALVLLLTLGSYALLNGATDQQSSSPASPSPDVLRANTRLVVVDVVATDGKGQPVPDLKAEDFVLLEDGKPQKISGFSLQQAAASVLVASGGQLPANVITNAPKFQSGSMNVILFDANNGDFVEHAYAKDQLVKFLNSAELGRPVAIFAMQGQLKMLSDFTTDNKALAAAVAKYTPPAQTANADSFESRESPFGTAGAFHTSERSIETTLSQLNALAKVLAGYSGRKNLIWLSESFPLTLFPETSMRGSMSGSSLHSTESGGGATAGISGMEGMQTNFSYRSYAAQVKKVTDALMAAQVAVYPVDAGALSKDDHLSAQHTMNEMAEGTGGKAFKNTNDLALSLKTSIEDGSTYYTLAYYPENKTWNGQFRSIQVQGVRPGLILRYRLGYYAVDPEKTNKEDSDAVAENFSRSLQLDAPSSTAVVFQAQVSPPSDKTKKVVVTFHVDPRSIVFEQKDDGKESAKLSCTVWAYGKNKEKPEMFSGTVSANLKPDEYQVIMQQHFLPCSQELDLKPGNYALRLGVLDRSSNKIGTASAMVAVQ
jgi:VWFA-related protein